MIPKIILASQSPRRKQLLEWAEVPFEVINSSIDEIVPPGVPVEDVPVQIAKDKALAVREKLKHHLEWRQQDNGAMPVLAADTVVVLDGEVIGKPADRDDAIHILSRLSGNKHTVITGVYILHGDKTIAFSDSTQVQFHELTVEQIIFYVDKYQPYDKAGAYAIQEWIGVVGIKSVQGDFYNVMGLPVSRVVQALQNLS